MKSSSIYIGIITLALLTACGEEEKPLYKAEKFNSIFDTNEFNKSYKPIGVQQTNDEGYLILAEKNLPETNVTGVYLLKADKYGNFVKDLHVGDSLVNPVARFSKINDRYYFFCMSALNLVTATQAKLFSIDENLDLAEVQTVGLQYPAVSNLSDNNLILLSYDNENKQSVISEITTSGAIQKSKGYTVGVGEGSEKSILEHYLKTDRQFPFDVGKIASGVYYFNGFYEYTFSLVFTNANSDNPLGVVQGQQDKGGFSALYPIESTTFAAARFNFGSNFILPKQQLNPTGFSSSTDLSGYSLPELLPNAQILIQSISVNGREVLVFGSNTKSKQIGLYYYDKGTGEFINTRYIGASNPFEIAAITQTADDGLILVGTTHLAGRFPRICLIKLSKDDLKSDISS
jgi:hypothetical protein